MKKTAFLQALVLVVLLSCSWLILLNRLTRQVEGNPASDDPEIVAPDRQQGKDPSEPEEGFSKPVDAGKPDNAHVPAGWQEWISYLELQDNPQDLRIALESMRESLFSLPVDEKRARLLELLESGINMQTAIRFRVGPGGILSGAPDLQTILLDWLGQVDPVLAARTGKKALLDDGFSLGPDQYVLHLRNYAWGSADSPDARGQFVRSQFDRLISNSEWIDNPVPSVAESMDFAVFLGDGGHVRELSGLMAEGANPGIAHASSMAIERLVDIDPLPAARGLLDSIGQPGMNPTARAGFLARLDPADPLAYELLTEYISPGVTTRGEAAAFLRFFPNLNRTFSNNLVSRQNPITAQDNHMDRLEAALEAVQDWQAAAIRRDLKGELLATEQRLTSQITGKPAP